jgi:predicted transposase YbfD/YdcC
MFLVIIEVLYRYCKRVTDHYAISRMITSAEKFAAMIRSHWSTENQLHWLLDVLFRADASQAREDQTPENLNILKEVIQGSGPRFPLFRPL